MFGYFNSNKLHCDNRDIAKEAFFIYTNAVGIKNTTDERAFWGEEFVDEYFKKANSDSGTDSGSDTAGGGEVLSTQEKESMITLISFLSRSLFKLHICTNNIEVIALEFVINLPVLIIATIIQLVITVLNIFYDWNI